MGTRAGEVDWETPTISSAHVKTDSSLQAKGGAPHPPLGGSLSAPLPRALRQCPRSPCSTFPVTSAVSARPHPTSLKTLRGAFFLPVPTLESFYYAVFRLLLPFSHLVFSTPRAASRSCQLHPLCQTGKADPQGLLHTGPPPPAPGSEYHSVLIAPNRHI